MLAPCSHRGACSSTEGIPLLRGQSITKQLGNGDVSKSKYLISWAVPPLLSLRVQYRKARKSTEAKWSQTRV